MVNGSQYTTSVRDSQAGETFDSDQNHFWQIRKDPFLQFETLQSFWYDCVERQIGR